MNPELTGGAILGIASTLAVLVFYNIIKIIIQQVKFDKAYAASPHAIPKDPYSGCWEQHSWVTAHLRFPRQNLVGQYLVCTICGDIAGTELRLNDPALTVVRAYEKARTEQRAIEDEAKAKVEFDLEYNRDNWIAANQTNITQLALSGNAEGLKRKLEIFFAYAVSTHILVVDNVNKEFADREDRKSS